MLSRDIFYRQLISRRLFLLGIGKLGLLGLLITRLFYMQLIKKDEYKTLSEKNRIKLILLTPSRGKIYDRQGLLLASNKNSFHLFLDKSAVHKIPNKKYQDDLELVTKILDIHHPNLEELKHTVKKASSRTPVLLFNNLSWRQVSSIEEYNHLLGTVFISVGDIRYYHHSNSISHLTGYLGIINDQEKKQLGVVNTSAIYVGKAGIEKYYDSYLRGEFGYEKMEVNASGKYVRNLGKIDSTAGKHLHLTIDIQKQNEILKLLPIDNCAIVVMNCRTGEVIINISLPNFDANNFNNLTTKYWQELLNNPDKPLIDKVVQGQYPSGSIFKLITIIAALEKGIPSTKIINCASALNGRSKYGGNQFRCWYSAGHGNIDMVSAIKHSCNNYIYEIARIIGEKAIITTAKKFGFGSKTNIDLPVEATGFIPNRDWKKQRFNTSWTIGDTLNLSIGQGFLLVTPIQLARFATAIASSGTLYEPNIIKGNTPASKIIDIKPQYIKLVQEAMYQTVNNPGGTAYNYRIQNKPYQLAGKTGTAQVHAKTNYQDDLNRKNIARYKRNHALFIGFAPYDKPLYSVTVLVPHGGSGSKGAAPIAAKVIETLL